MDPLHHCFPNENKLNLSFLFHTEKLERFRNGLKILLSKTLSSLTLQSNFHCIPLSHAGFQHKFWGWESLWSELRKEGLDTFPTLWVPQS